MHTPPLVLIVDDEPEILEIYGKQLNNSGLQTITANDGDIAYNLAREQHPDLILMDVKMPVVNGVEAAMKIKNDPEIKNTKIIFLTAFSDPDKPDIDIDVVKLPFLSGLDPNAKRFEAAGGIDFIKKGISLEELTKKVKEHLGVQ